MPEKRRLFTPKFCFGSEKAGLFDHSYNKCALDRLATLQIITNDIDKFGHTIVPFHQTLIFEERLKS